MVRLYEFTFIFQPGFVQQEVDGLVQELSSLLSKNSAKLEKYEYWGLLDFAYPIKQFTKGHYCMMCIRISPGALGELRRRIKLDERIVRYAYGSIDKVDEEDSFMISSV